MADVLIVEDNEMNLRLARDLLEYRGHHVTGARDVAEFRAAITNTVPDLVLMDIRIGNASGEALLGELRTDPRLRAVPVIAVTAQAMDGDRERLLAAGFDGYVSKPLDTRRFGATIESFVRPR